MSDGKVYDECPECVHGLTSTCRRLVSSPFRLFLDDNGKVKDTQAGRVGDQSTRFLLQLLFPSRSRYRLVLFPGLPLVLDPSGPHQDREQQALRRYSGTLKGCLIRVLHLTPFLFSPYPPVVVVGFRSAIFGKIRYNIIEKDVYFLTAAPALHASAIRRTASGSRFPTPPAPPAKATREAAFLLSFSADSIPTLLADNSMVVNRGSCRFRLAEFCNGISTFQSRF